MSTTRSGSIYSTTGAPKRRASARLAPMTPKRVRTAEQDSEQGAPSDSDAPVPTPPPRSEDDTTPAVSIPVTPKRARNSKQDCESNQGALAGAPPTPPSDSDVNIVPVRPAPVTPTHLAQGAPVDALDPPMLVLDFDTIFSLGAARSWSAHLEAVSALPPGLPSVGEQLYSMRSDVCGLFNRLVDLGDNPEGCSNERMQEMANAAHDLGRQWSASWISRSDACALHAAQVVSALNWGAPAHEEPAAGGLATPPAELVHTPDAAVGISLNECVTEPAVPVRCTPLESHRQGLTMVGQARHRSPRRDPAPGPSHLPLFTGIGSADEEHATTLEVSHPNMLVCDLLPDQISGHVDMSRLVAVVVPRSGPRFRSEQLRSYSIR
jgi:hypothetical protein